MSSFTPQLPAVPTAYQYAHDVVTKRQVAGKYVRQCCRRFLDDLDKAPARGYILDQGLAKKSVDFFGLLRHTKGVWAKKVETAGFVLSPWQVFCNVNLFGWINKDTGFRRFQEGYIEVARKNGKSTWMGGIGNFMLIGDGEPGAEVYSAATTREQAKIIFNAAKEQVQKSPGLAKKIGVFRNNLHVDDTSSKFEPLAAEAGTLDGLNIHCGLIDELHEHPDRSLYEVLNTATGSRSQPLILEITTAGFSREGICWDQRSYGCKVLSRKVEDDRFFAFIACMDKGDDWTDQTKWVKANPNLGYSTSLEAIQPKFKKALEQPAAQNEFLRKHLNVWTNNKTAWLVDGCWEKNCAIPEDQIGDIKQAVALRAAAIEKLKNRQCFGGLDLAETDDLNAYALVFPPCGDIQYPKMELGKSFFKMKSGEIKYLAEVNIQQLERLQAGERTLEPPPNHPLEKYQDRDDKWSILVWYWIPEAFLGEQAKKVKMPYEAWHRAGLVTTMPGHAINQEQLRKDVNEINSQFRVKSIGYDAWNTGWMAPKLLEDGYDAVKIPPRYELLSPATKALTSYLVAGIVDHFGHPILDWNASNVVLMLDSAGNQKPDKAQSKAKIDGVMAVVMAVSRALAVPVEKHPDDPNKYRVHML